MEWKHYIMDDLIDEIVSASSYSDDYSIYDDDYYEDDYDDYIEQGTEALMNDNKDYYGTYAKAYLDEFGKNAFKDFVDTYGDNVINYDDMAEDIVNTDGMGNSLATYDGVEHEVSVNGTDYYIFRTN